MGPGIAEGDKTMHQIFLDKWDLPKKRVLGTHICLHYAESDHLKRLPDKVRMACDDWGKPFASLRASLSRAGPPMIAVAPDETVPFHLCPDLPFSVISERIADKFDLLKAGPPRVTYFERLALKQVLPGIQDIPVRETLKAWVLIACSPSVHPRPIIRAEKPFEFIIPGSSLEPTQDLAVLGRNVIDHMLVLYQGRHAFDETQGRIELKPRCYFGRNGVRTLRTPRP